MRMPLVIFLVAAFPILTVAQEEGPSRTRVGLLALYDFSEPEGALIRDRAQVGAPIDLEIDDINDVRRSEGTLQIIRKVGIRSQRPPSRLNAAIKRSGEITIEAWLQSSTLEQSGPARIVSLSKGSSDRNATLGQDGEAFDVRFRTSKTNRNGLPSLATPKGKVTTALTHVVYVRDRSGRTRLYVDGEKVSEKLIEGALRNWAGNYHLSLANEISKDRPWLGTFHLVALYGRDLRPEEVRRHFQLGPAAPTEAPEGHLADANTTLFDEAIAPLFAKHCLECHDASNREGEFDLSNKAAALAGGSEGPAIVPGNADKSYLWELVLHDDMPEDREPLSPSEKKLLKEWIDGGAKWSSEMIDPLAHKRDRRATEQFVRRLTVPEYTATVQAAVGVDIRKEAREILPPDLRADGFSNTAYNLGVDFANVEGYAKLASLIVSRMDVPAFTKRFGKNVKFTDKTMGAMIQNMGKWLLRGPLDDDEVIAYRGISTTVASAGGTYEEALSYIIEAMLQSPRFIYQIENQRGDGQVWPVSEFELASRMSYIMWGASPDRVLMDAADRGNLYDPEDIEKQVDRMMQDPRTRERSLQFMSEWLHLGRLQNLRPNKDLFPHWRAELAEDMKAETLAFFNDLVWEQNRPLADLLNAQFTYVTPRLADHYRLAVRPEGEPQQLQRVSLKDDAARGGLLTQGSILTIGGDEASTVTRGLFVLHDLLRSGVNDPPPGVDTSPVPAEPGRTQRSIAEERIESRSCGGCHSKFEPLAFGMGKFDGLGTYMERDHHGNALRDDGEILFPNHAEPIPFANAGELMDLLAQSPRVQENFAWKLTQYALGRPLVSADTAAVYKIHRLAQAGGGTYKSLLKAIVLSDLVQTMRTES